MAIKTRKPYCSIKIQKMIQRKEGKITEVEDGEMDITALLGDSGSVSVHKSLSQPMGSFVIQLPDKPYTKPSESLLDSILGNDSVLDTLYGLLEPMDHVTIRLAADSYKYASSPCPVTMRGFITNVSRREALGTDGKPRRMVVIQGNDYGLLFQTIRFLSYLPARVSENGEVAPEAALHKLMYDFIRTGTTDCKWTNPADMDEKKRLMLGVYPVDEFFAALLECIVNPWIRRMKAQAKYTADFQEITPKFSVGAGWIFASSTRDFLRDGPIWNLFAIGADTPWNELFLDDYEDQIRLVHRPTAYYSPDDELIQQTLDGQLQVTELEAHELSWEAIQSMDLSRDSGVVNFFWVDTPEFGGLNYAQYFQLADERGNPTDKWNAIRETVFIGDNPGTYPNADMTLFGVKQLKEQSRLLHLRKAEDFPLHAKEEKIADYGVNVNLWHNFRRLWLRDANKDNLVFENGIIGIKGNTDLRAGMRLKIKRGQFTFSAYIDSVTHQFAPFQSFTTMLRVTRCTNWYQRNKASVTAPYTTEGRQGVYAESK